MEPPAYFTPHTIGLASYLALRPAYIASGRVIGRQIRGFQGGVRECLQSADKSQVAKSSYSMFTCKRSSFKLVTGHLGTVSREVTHQIPQTSPAPANLLRGSVYFYICFDLLSSFTYTCSFISLVLSLHLFLSLVLTLTLFFTSTFFPVVYSEVKSQVAQSSY